MTNELKNLNHAGSGTTYADAKMNRDGVGTGHGQFSAWLTSPSDVAGELDFETERNISTFYFELPIEGSKYNVPYRNVVGDNSNSFHPSGDTMEQLWNDAILDLMAYVAQQARSPYCPADTSDNRLVNECPAVDFGIVGAKISDAVGEPGLLDFDPDTREETLPAGRHEIIFAVQNFSALPSSTASFYTLTIAPEGDPVDIQIKRITMLPGERTVAKKDYRFRAGKKYRVIISLGSDDFSANNKKVFAFKVTDSSEMRFRTVLGRSVITLNDDASQLRYKGSFLLDRPIKAADDGMTVSMRGYLPYIVSQVSPPEQALYKLPSGSPWWDRSNSKEKTWVYSDPNGKVSPITRLIIQQSKASKRGKNRLINLEFWMKGGGVQAYSSARSYTVNIELEGDRLGLNAIAKGKEIQLPAKQQPPENETEDEPGPEYPNDLQ